MVDRILKGFKRLCILGLVLIIGWVALAPHIGGVAESVTTNMDAPMTTRTLAPRVVTTTTKPLIVAETRPLPVTKPGDSTDLLVIDGEKVYRLPRSQAVALYLWIAIHQQDTQ